MKNTIGILGTGRMAVRLAKLFAACGHEVRIIVYFRNRTEVTHSFRP